MTSTKGRPAVGGHGEPGYADCAGRSISSSDNSPQENGQRLSKWRETYKVHPAADVFPMMSEEELDALGADIKAKGLLEPVSMIGDWFVDGRNRLEAAERIGYRIYGGDIQHLPAVDPVAYIISKNIRRRHLTSGQLADVLVKLARIEVKKETGSSEPVSESKGGRGKKSALKAKAIEINAALP
jgi:hypothetical protein